MSAQKRDESIRKTPISIAAFNEAHLENLGLTNLANIQNAVPNLSMRPMPGSQSAMRTFIRGIGNNDAQIAQDPAIAVYADGIYSARSTGLTSELADVERIEVLRGPQGGLYARLALSDIPLGAGGDFKIALWGKNCSTRNTCSTRSARSSGRTRPAYSASPAAMASM